jgi:hypothetical protein
MATNLSLSQLVNHTADQLRQIRKQDVTDPVIRFDKCTIELAVGAETTGGGGISFWILSAEASKKTTDGHKITLEFSAVGSKPVVAMSKAAGPSSPPERKKSER